MSTRILSSLILAVSATAVMTAGAAELKTQQQKLSYTIGFQIGNNLKKSGVPVDAQALTQAIKDVLKGAKPKLTTDEMQVALTTYQAERMKEEAAKGEKNLKDGKAFMAANKTKKGVKTLPSGVQYQVIKEGTGPIPKSSDVVEVNYRGTLLDGKEFDSSKAHGKPAVFPVGAVIKGWQDAVTHMKVGSKWKVWIPSELAYGEHGAPPVIGPNATLSFEIELLGIKEPPKAPAKSGS